MYKKFKDYDFREITGHFVLIKNTNIVKEPDKYNDIDESVEKIKKLIVEDTRKYYKNQSEDDIDDSIDDAINIDALNEEMPTRSIYDLYEPMYGYVGIEKKRGLLLYLLGNEEDKMRYVYAPTYLAYGISDIDNIEIEIIDKTDYANSIEFKDQLQNDEELDEEVIKTRNLKEFDIFRLKTFPDFVNCIILYKNVAHFAKVKLTKYENGNIYATYHKQIGTLKIIKNYNTLTLLFKPNQTIDNEECLNEYITDIIQELENDFGLEKSEIMDFVKNFKSNIEKGYIEGDLPFEIINKIWNEMKE